METGGEAVGSGSPFCHFWFGLGSFPLELLYYKPQLGGRREALNLTPRLAPSNVLFSLSHPPSPLLLVSQYISGSSALVPTPCPLSLSQSSLYSLDFTHFVCVPQSPFFSPVFLFLASRLVS